MGPIETVYRGITFRSRLEARWARFFDVLDVVWEYEPEGYQLESVRYLPDFWLPHVRNRGAAGGVFFEVKPTSPTEGEIHKARMLALGFAHPVMVATRAPKLPDIESIDEFVADGRGTWEDFGLTFARCDNCGQMDIGFYASDVPTCACGKAEFNVYHPALNDARYGFQDSMRWQGGKAA